MVREVDEETDRGLIALIDSYHMHIEGETKGLMKASIKDALRGLRADEYRVYKYWKALVKSDHQYLTEKLK